MDFRCKYRKQQFLTIMRRVTCHVLATLTKVAPYYISCSVSFSTAFLLARSEFIFQQWRFPLYLQDLTLQEPLSLQEPILDGRAVKIRHSSEEEPTFVVFFNLELRSQREPDDNLSGLVLTWMIQGTSYDCSIFLQLPFYNTILKNLVLNQTS